MSIQAMDWALKQPVKPAAAKLLLIAIANYANHEGKAWPSKTTLANDCCIDKSVVCRHMKTLVDLGYVTTTERRIQGVSLTSIIALNISTHGGSGTGARGVVAPMRHKPSLEPLSIHDSEVLGDTVDGDEYASGRVHADDEVPV